MNACKVAVTLFALAFGVAFAQAGSAEEQAVRAADNAEAVAVLKRDVPAMEKLWAEEFMVNSPNNAVTPNRAAVIELVKCGVISYSSFERQIESIRVYGDTAVVMGSETVRPVGGAAAGQTVQRRYTNIWRKEGGTWRAIARHANVIPQAKLR